jgi:DNA-binding NarL/FixJ family response regulator
MSIAERPREISVIGFVVEDSPPMQALLREVLTEAYDDIRVETSSSLRQARERLRALKATGSAEQVQVALIDIGLPDGSGLDLLEDLRRIAPDALRIVATAFDDDEYLMRAFGAGAQGYLLKDEPKNRLIERLRNVQNGEPAISPSLAHKILGHFVQHATGARADPDSDQLTHRETEILQVIGRGLRVSEAATVLGVSANTISGHVKAIYAKLGISTRAEAALEAVRRRLI